jgi:4a-hydroxytetrahydrobiopterin dehydratase
MSDEPLSAEAIASALESLEGWTHAEDRITRAFKFGDFREAMAFLVRVGFEAEGQGHHPEIFNVYNNVRISLNTHSAGGKVTEKDIDLARRIDALT